MNTTIDLSNLSIEELIRIEDEAKHLRIKKTRETYHILEVHNYNGNITGQLIKDDDIAPAIQAGAVKVSYIPSGLGIGTNKVYIRKDMNEIMDTDPEEFDAVAFLKSHIMKTYDDFYDEAAGR